MKDFQLDNTEERTRRIRVCEKKFYNAMSTYFSCGGEGHKTTIRNMANEALDEAVLRWQDCEALKYDIKEMWDLNYNDYDEPIEIEYGKNNS